MGPWKSAAGMLEVEITSASPPEALDSAIEAGIPVFDAAIAGELSVTFQIYRKDIKKLQALCKKRGDNLNIRRRRGIYWTARSMGKRPLLILGLALLIALTWSLSNRVYFVRVEGNEAVADNLILEQAADCGIRFGASRRLVRSEKVKNALLEAIPELSWAGVNTSGCVATVSVREKTSQEKAEPEGSGGIVAARDGIIRSCTVLSGSSLCKPGQAVRAGELLVSGYSDFGICIRATPAKAEIYADTNRELEVYTPANRTKRGTMTRSEEKYTLIIGKKRINFFRGSGILDSGCVKMTSVKTLTLPGGFALPVKLVTERREWYETAEVPVTQEAAEALLFSFSGTYLTGEMTAGQILQSHETVTGQGDVYCLAGRYDCLEMIGRSINWEKLDKYGKND